MQAVLQAAIQAQVHFSQPLALLLARQYRQAAQRLLQPVFTQPQRRLNSLASRLSEWMIRPLTGIPILLAAVFLLAIGLSGLELMPGDPDAFTCNAAIPTGQLKVLYENLAARLAFRNYSWWQMAKRAAKNPRHAIHVAKKAVGRKL